MPQGATTHDLASRLEAGVTTALGRRSVVLVGMMGSGKSSIGRRVALRLGIPFVDADAEIEQAAGMSISDIFAARGEAEFRTGEARVIARLLDGGPQVLATGGGSFLFGVPTSALMMAAEWGTPFLTVLLNNRGYR